LRHEPGIERVASTDAPPIGNIAMSMSGVDSTGKPTPEIDVVHVGIGYLETIGAQLVAGRLIDASDRLGSQPVVVLTETGARRLFPDGPALGRVLPVHKLTVVGIIKDVRQRQLEASPGVTAYLPLAQDERAGRRWTTFVARTSRDPMSLQAAIRRVVRAMDPALPAPAVTSMEKRLGDTVAPRRFAFVLLGLFASLAGVLAVIGLYGVLAYLVADRTREIGIRIALGADVARVRRMVIVQGMSLVLLGTAIGVAGSLFAAGTLKTMVYEVSVYDPRAFIAGAVLLSVVGYFACSIPARRASRVDPILALRAE
jgi:predicted permease